MNMGKNIISDKLSKLNNMKTFQLTERYDCVNAQKLIHSEILDDEEKGGLIKYLKNGKGGKVEVEYTQNEIGRLNIKVKGLKKGETCMTQPYMKRIIKSAICKKDYVDLDMVNAHPIFLEHALKDKGYQTKALSYYNNNRDTFFDQMSKKGISRDICKVLVMKMFYNGSLPAFCKEYKLRIEDVPLSLKELDNEIKINTKALLQTDELLEYRLKARENKGADYYNLDGTAMSYYLQTIECRALMVLFNFLKGKGHTIGALIHDGLHLKKIEGEGYGDLIAEAEGELKEKTGIPINLKIKEFSAIAELDDMIVIETDKEGGAYITDKLKNDYVISQERTFMRIHNVWTYNDKVIKRNLIKEVGNMNIFIKVGEDIKPYSTMAKPCMNMLQFVEPTEDEDFIDKLWSSNLYKLCFKNGYFDFKKGSLKPYDVDTHTCIKINRDYETASETDIQAVYEKILNPIFNNDTDLMNCWLNYIARGLAGHIEDKNWGVGMGERDCGKGVLVGLLENCFGEYCRSTNSENFLYKHNGADSAKALSWLVPFEFKRLLLTNEITRDAEGRVKINGNILKKLSSGGDKIEARVNHKDEINFKIQARVCMFCNDLPPIEPADTKETSYMFRYPSKFLSPDDDRLGKPLMRQKYTMDPKDNTIEYLVDGDGNKIMENVCNFYKKDDEIKSWTKKPEIMNAFIAILFRHYGKKTPLSTAMKEEIDDFKDEEKEEDRFLDLFNFFGDKEWITGDRDWVSIPQISNVLRRSKINLSAQKYKNYLTAKGSVKAKRLNEMSGKREYCWIGIQLNHIKLKEFITD